MSVRDGDLPGDERIRARATSDGARIVAGSLGLALVLAAGFFLVTDEVTDSDRSPGALAPLIPAVAPGTTTAGTRPVPAIATTLAPAPGVAPAESPAADPGRADAGRADAGRADAARPASARPGGQGRTAGAVEPQPLAAAGGPVDAGAVSSSTLTTAEGSIRVTTAKADLAERSDLLLAADGGDGRCTRNLRIGAPDARVVPDMLLCWRTSATRSVITLATATRGRPSEMASLAVLDREWARLD